MSKRFLANANDALGMRPSELRHGTETIALAREGGIRDSAAMTINEDTTRAKEGEKEEHGIVRSSEGVVQSSRPKVATQSQSMTRELSRLVVQSLVVYLPYST